VALQIGPKPPVRLSTYWQETLVAEVAGPDPAKGATRIAASVPAAESRKWTEGNPKPAPGRLMRSPRPALTRLPRSRRLEVRVSSAQGGKGVLPSVNLYRVGRDYETKAFAAVKQQLGRDGVRLARILRDGLK